MNWGWAASQYKAASHIEVYLRQTLIQPHTVGGYPHMIRIFSIVLLAHIVRNSLSLLSLFQLFSRHLCVKSLPSFPQFWKPSSGARFLGSPRFSDSACKLSCKLSLKLSLKLSSKLSLKLSLKLYLKSSLMLSLMVLLLFSGKLMLI